MLFVLLGNPGKEYEKTRHNVAWILADNAFKDLEWKNDSYILSSVAFYNYNNERHIFAKPTTYMNLSGNAVAKLVKHFNISKDEVIVVQDDIDIPIGNFKIVQRKGAAHHNGILSIFGILGKEVVRIRAGIGSENRKVTLVNYVLQNFSPDELKTLELAAENFKLIVHDIISLGIVKATNVWNTKNSIS